MKIKITYNNGTIEVRLKDIYTEEQLIEALSVGEPIALTTANNLLLIIQPLNIIAIEQID